MYLLFKVICLLICENGGFCLVSGLCNCVFGYIGFFCFNGIVCLLIIFLMYD